MYRGVVVFLEVAIIRKNNISYMPKITDTTNAFIVKLQSLYDIEKQLEKALPKMAKAAFDPDLKEGFIEHLEETKIHSERLEDLFDDLGVDPKKLKTEGIRGIIADGEWVAEVDAPDAVKDAMLAGAARYAEHYEMAGYLSAIAEANALGLTDAAIILTKTLNEEMAADEILAEAQARNLSNA
jgi:ferritin-like metal-binding protein YciE